MVIRLSELPCGFVNARFAASREEGKQARKKLERNIDIPLQR
jgi:hypothetical protein